MHGLIRTLVREQRHACGRSQAELAVTLGVSRQTVNAIETGRYNPLLPLAIALARFLGARLRRCSSLNRMRMIEPAERSRCAVPALAVGIGILSFIASTIGGNPSGGLIVLGVMVAYALLLLVAGRSDVVRMLRGQPVDERYWHIETRATVIAALAVIEFAKGEGGWKAITP